MLNQTTVPFPHRPLFQDSQHDYPNFPWLKQLRKQASESFIALGEIPTIRQEYWKYTNLAPLKNQTFLLSNPQSIIPEDDFAPSFFGTSGDAYQKTIQEGSIQEPFSASPDKLPQGVILTTLAQTIHSDPVFLKETLGTITQQQTHAFVALNTAFFQDVLVLRVQKGIKVSVPIVVTFRSVVHDQPRMWHPRVLIVLEDNSQATFIEHHTCVHDNPTYFSNTTLEIQIGKDACLTHYKLQQESPQAFHIAHTTIRQDEKSEYQGFTLNIGGRIARNEVHAEMTGAQSRCCVNGAYLIRGQQHSDVTSVIRHNQPWCRSRQVYKGVVEEQGQAVFQGKISVAAQAQKTDGYQLNQTMLLSEKAQITTKPELEIFADDVKCSHGATTGALDDDALFYLRTRGIQQEQARHLLIIAFLQEALLEIQQPSVSTIFHQCVEKWLKKDLLAVSP